MKAGSDNMKIFSIFMQNIKLEYAQLLVDIYSGHSLGLLFLSR